jgi:hypothetical protein
LRTERGRVFALPTPASSGPHDHGRGRLLHIDEHWQPMTGWSPWRRMVTDLR